MGQGAFPLSKEDVQGEMQSMDRLFIHWETTEVNVDEKIRLLVKSLDKKRICASFNIVDARTNETLKQITVQLSDGEGKSEYIQIPKEWEAKEIKAVEE